MATERLAPEDLQAIIAGVASSHELMAGIATHLQQSLPAIRTSQEESSGSPQENANNQQESWATNSQNQLVTENEQGASRGHQ